MATCADLQQREALRIQGITIHPDPFRWLDTILPARRIRLPSGDATNAMPGYWSGLGRHFRSPGSR